MNFDFEKFSVFLLFFPPVVQARASEGPSPPRPPLLYHSPAELLPGCAETKTFQFRGAVIEVGGATLWLCCAARDSLCSWRGEIDY